MFLASCKLEDAHCKIYLARWQFDRQTTLGPEARSVVIAAEWLFLRCLRTSVPDLVAFVCFHLWQTDSPSGTSTSRV